MVVLKGGGCFFVSEVSLYRAVSIRRSHNTRSHTGCADVDVKYLTSAH